MSASRYTAVNVSAWMKAPAFLVKMGEAWEFLVVILNRSLILSQDHQCLGGMMAGAYAVAMQIPVSNTRSLILTPNRLALDGGLAIQPGANMQKKRKLGSNCNKTETIPFSSKPAFSQQLYLSSMLKTVSWHHTPYNTNTIPTEHQMSATLIKYVLSESWKPRPNPGKWGPWCRCSYGQHYQGRRWQ